MDNLLLKIICTAVILVLFVTICLGATGDSSTEIYKQPAIDPSPETPGETHIGSDYGMRAEMKSEVDNSASSRSYIDSNPE
jgi:hypothetical protein